MKKENSIKWTKDRKGENKQRIRMVKPKIKI